MGRIRKKLSLRRKKQAGFVTLLLVGAIIVLGLLLSGAVVNKDNLPADGTVPLSVVTKAPDQNRDNLQLKTLDFISAVPTPAQCQTEGLVTDGCSCPAQIWRAPGLPPITTDKPEEVCGPNHKCDFEIACEQCNWSHACPVSESIVGRSLDPNNPAPAYLDCGSLQYKLTSGATFCFGKPVIYLYPEKLTKVDVQLTIPGEIYISIPQYPTDGWKNIMAQPTGNFTYQGKTYKELYYESKVNVNIKPKSGIIISSSQLTEKLTDLTDKLGLKKNEQQEFLEYWMPKLTSLKKPYILFSVLTNEQKEFVDHVAITPNPDVFINFLVYFKGLDLPIAIEPLKISAPPQRSGFTAVEWGGTIDQ